jgi:hypothetical protein
VIVGWAAFVPLAVVAMAVAMYADGEPDASLSDIVVLAFLAVLLLAPAVLCYAAPSRPGRSSLGLRRVTGQHRTWTSDLERGRS